MMHPLVNSIHYYYGYIDLLFLIVSFFRFPGIVVVVGVGKGSFLLLMVCWLLSLFTPHQQSNPLTWLLRGEKAHRFRWQTWLFTVFGFLWAVVFHWAPEGSLWRFAAWFGFALHTFLFAVLCLLLPIPLPAPLFVCGSDAEKSTFSSEIATTFVELGALGQRAVDAAAESAHSYRVQGCPAPVAQRGQIKARIWYPIIENGRLHETRTRSHYASDQALHTAAAAATLDVTLKEEKAAEERVLYKSSALPPGSAHSVFTVGLTSIYNLGIPGFVFSHLELGKTNSVEVSPLEFLKSYPEQPVIVFSHGLFGMPEVYTTICENLAANGYLVIAPLHTDGSTCLDYVAPPIPWSDHLTPEELSIRMDFRKRQAVRRSLDCLAWVDALGVERFSIGGHSFGGGTASLVAKIAPSRVDAAVSLDGWAEIIPDPLVNAPLRGPRMLWLNSTLFQWEKNVNLMKAYNRSLAAAEDSAIVEVFDTGHHDYNDFKFQVPWLTLFSRWRGDRSQKFFVGGVDATEVTEAYMNATISWIRSQQGGFAHTLKQFSSFLQ